MQFPSTPENEVARLEALQDLQVLDSSPELAFDALVHAASVVCDVPISLISLIDRDRQWFKASIGLPGVTETPREMAFCAHAIHEDSLFEVSDATSDVRFADNPLVVGHPNIKFYTGAPIVLSDGSRAGTLCVIDRKPRHLDDRQREVLRCLAVAAAYALEGRSAILKVQKINRDLADKEDRLRNLYDCTPAMMHSIDALGRLISVSNAWLVKMGYERSEVIGRPSSEFLTAPSREHAVKTVLPAFFLTGCCDNVEYQMRTKSGSVIDVLLSAILERDAAGRPLRSMAVIDDVTLRKQQEKKLRKSEALLTRTGQVAGVGGWEVDLASNEIYWSDQTCRIHGMEPGYRPTMERAIEFYAPEARPQIQAAVERGVSFGEDWDLQLPVVRADGIHIWARAMGTVEFSDGKPIRLIGAFQDITESRRMMVELAEQHELLRVTLQSIGDAVITSDALGNVQWLNPVAERLTGWLSEEAKGRPLTQVFNIVNEETRAPTENPVETCLEQGKIVGLANHTLLISRDGQEFGIEDSAAPIRNENGEVQGVVLVFHDVTEQRRLSGEMTYRASHDSLTGLINRSEFETRLRRILNKSHEDGSEHALLYIDLDQFKLVNDACGHAVGDQLLQQVSKLLQATVRDRDTLSRLGGDEFGVILEHCSAAQAQRVAQQMCDSMDDFRFNHDGRRFRIGTSIGLVPVDNRWKTTEAIQQAADSSCYAAKEAGRNRVHAWFDTDLAARARHGEMQWTTRIEQALDEDRFVLYAQRIQAADGQCTGVHAEVLLRMLDSDGSLIPPGAFLPAAERYHLISRIDRWVLRHSIAWMRAAPQLERIENLSVNLSGQSIGDRAFHRWAIEILTDCGAEVCSKLCLEITETAAVTNLGDAALFIEQVRTLNVRVALDDFGAGASSFGYLKTLPVDYLKIDGQFVRDVVDDPLDDAAVRCFVDVARVVGVKTVAEFVDHPAVLARLKTIGVDFVQGFLLHRPEPIDALLSFPKATVL